MAENALRLKARIKTSKNISQITRAMEMVSASKMRRAQGQSQAGRPFSEELADTLYRLTQQIDPGAHPLLSRESTSNKRAILLISTDRGLAGGLNTALFNYAANHAKKSEFEPVFITIGKKARNFVAKTRFELVAAFDHFGDRPQSTQVTPISQMLINGFIKGEYREVNIIYPKFISTLTQKPHQINLLPLGTPEEIGQNLEEQNYIQGNELKREYKFEPDPNTILEWLLPYYVENRIYQIILESLASEHSARMVAMKNAHNNASDLVDDLTLLYNRARQAKVTNELLDAYSARVVLE